MHFLIDFDMIFPLVLMSTIAVRYVQYMKEQLIVLHQLLLSVDCLSFLINNKDEKLCSHKHAVQTKEQFQ